MPNMVVDNDVSQEKNFGKFGLARKIREEQLQLIRHVFSGNDFCIAQKAHPGNEGLQHSD